MGSENRIEESGNILGIISFILAVINFLLILNWAFRITHYQGLQGMPMLMPLFIAPVGLILGIASLKRENTKISRFGIISNIILFSLPFLYWIIGTLFFGA